MYTNADITLYSYGADKTYSKSIINGVFWQESKQSNIEKTGLVNADSVKIFIPCINVPNGLKLTVGKDIVVKGEIDFEFDNTSSTTIGTSLSTLKGLADVYTITVADKKTFGSQSMQHYQLSCK